MENAIHFGWDKDTTESAAAAGCIIIGRIGDTMLNIYDNPNEKQGQQRKNHERHAMGNGPAGLSAQMDNRINLALIVITLAIVLALVLF
ncbi:MAG: hypothetical protein FPO08_04755 [Geobacter sp.]|nr:MAG: hypothetical protein FPO08_04755 [Geobacter sp.]